MIQKDTYTIAEVAKHLGVCPRTIRNYINSGSLPCIKLSKTLRGHIRIRRADLDLYLESHAHDPNA